MLPTGSAIFSGRAGDVAVQELPPSVTKNWQYEDLAVRRLPSGLRLRQGKVLIDAHMI
jgi:hypothetical protein